MKDFIKLRKTYYDKTKNCLEFVDGFIYMNPNFIESVTTGNPAIINGISYKYYYVQSQADMAGYISDDLDLHFGGDQCSKN